MTAMIQIFQIFLVFCFFFFSTCYKIEDYLMEIPPARSFHPSTGELVYKSLSNESQSNNVISRLWSVELEDAFRSSDELDELADKIAKELHMTNLGQIGQLFGYYVFAAPNFTNIEKKLQNHPYIKMFSREEIIKINSRYKKDKVQWHLSNDKKLLDCNVTKVWTYNISGNGVNVAIVDDGVDWVHEDLTSNYFTSGSFDFIDDDHDARPLPGESHGTLCSGVVAAAGQTCTVGVAYKSKFSSIRIIGGHIVNSGVANALNWKMKDNHIYSCSFGPFDDGTTAQSQSFVIAAAFAQAASKGRDSYGSIFVFASGNGGAVGDNCNYDQLITTIYTIPVASVTEHGRKPTYSERCSAIMTTTLSGRDYYDDIDTGRYIVTTDSLHKCNHDFTGTSASAPLASGIIALMLQVRPCLYWRDVHHIIAMTSSHVTLSGEVKLFDLSHQNSLSHFYTNQAGYTYNDYHGFGFLDAWKVVNAARVWKSVPEMSTLFPKCQNGDRVIPLNKPLELSCRVGKGGNMSTMENVIVTITITHEYRGMLEYIITCPSGTQAKIHRRPPDKSKDGLKDFVFRTVKCWGESPLGKFKFSIRDTRSKGNAGKLVRWKMTVYGSSMTLNEIQDRWKEVKSSYSDEDVYDKMKKSPDNCPTEESYDWWALVLIFVASFLAIVFVSVVMYFVIKYWLRRRKRRHNKAEAKWKAEQEEYLEEKQVEGSVITTKNRSVFT